ncbi:hypothetical protein B4W74_09980 [Staphylococcus intermedius]|uniref:Uncharacterized protein n=1 Tax=Staphylococcus intermedius NCTC 11048 TaxID=1141106 RepID=A0A380G5B4_STAIN|nr:hypothetical protein B5C04_09630 [Staphylococcus intermedius]PNZ53578.1 hypothetical protein CD138_04140 [Staphylococcus intermedius NCTC 11048]PCF78937.1 hypothetical protein B4W74_09980 [Staphylococcus intermedius]PCF79909.1 hypothetical protein B4W70_09620 [Staphylococcus intermedius]PCF86340.1 hypothetical protein B4W76_08855 [Staphylococcus intermedius]
MKKTQLDLIDLIAIIILIGIPLLCLYVFKIQTTTTFIIFGALLVLSILFDKKRRKDAPLLFHL